MNLADNIALPVWATTDEGRELVARIIAERPASFTRRGQWIEGGGVEVYRGATAGKLRQLHNAWLDREQAALDAQYEVTRFWDQEASDELHRTEDGNKLIARVLRETANVIPYDRMSLKERPDGSASVAA